MLWVEGPLSYVEQLCVQSFLDAGHEVTLYHYGPVIQVPEGVNLVHGNAILKRDDFIKHKRTNSLALFSDVFRYHLLTKSDRTIWADTDAYCMKPFETKTGHYFGWESAHHINGGVLGLPPDSPALAGLLEMTQDEFGIPEWYQPDAKAKLQAQIDSGASVHVSDLPWGVWGPHAVTHYLKKTGEATHAFPCKVLYPVPFPKRRRMLKAAKLASARTFLSDETTSIHLYGRRIREFLANRPNGLPEKGSLLDHLLKKHSIDPMLAPVSSKKIVLKNNTMNQAKGDGARNQVRAKNVNLTDLADNYGSDKGSIKHRYTELYHLLFNPYRRRKINFLEMGLLIGGPEHGIAKDRETLDLPSIRMWLEYFPKAHIHGLDISDFAWFEHERFTFHRCDMDKRSNIEKAAAAMPSLDIVIDDASHASHHQQNAFLEIFPKLASGGIYVIEDLRWQPDTYETKGFTKTAALLRSFIDDRKFSHTDNVLADAFNGLVSDISACIVHPVKYQKDRRDQVAVIHKR